MAPTPPTTRVLLYGLLCFAILMQMLGTPATLWTPNLDSDSANTSLLEGLSLPPSQEMFVPVGSDRRRFETAFRSPSILIEHILFRPPYVRYLPALG